MHVFYMTMFDLCVMSHIELLCICITILLLFSYKLLLLKINIALHKFALQHVYLLLS